MARLLEVKNLCAGVEKDGKLLKILDDISFSADEGEITGLAGESGCGKSMTALCIANLLPAGVEIRGGEIIYKKRDLTVLDENEMRAFRGEISVIFQDVRLALNPLMKIGKQITESLELARKETISIQRLSAGAQKQRDKSLALDLLESLGFNDPEKIFNGYPHQFSGGMCQRIMTAIAIIRKPKLLIADEPSSSLDEESQKQCLSLLLEMNQKKNMSMLIISHDLSIIGKYCSRFIIMYAGKIMEEGLSASLFNPLHPYTRALVNALPSKEKRGRPLANIPGIVPSINEQLSGCPFSPRCPKAQNICNVSFPQDYFKKEYPEKKVYCYFPNLPEENK